jgi:hypothetical protein
MALLGIALGASSCATCHRKSIVETTGPTGVTVQLRHVACGGDRAGLHAVAVSPDRPREEHVFFRLMFPRGFATSVDHLVTLQWRSSTLLVRYPRELRPAQRDSAVSGLTVEYEATVGN